MVDRATERVQRILAVIEEIPEGFVTTYGAVARVADTGPRQVAAVMANHPDTHLVPWHRVVAAGGRIADGQQLDRQVEALRNEGHVITNNRIAHFRAVEYQLD